MNYNHQSSHQHYSQEGKKRLGYLPEYFLLSIRWLVETEPRKADGPNSAIPTYPLGLKRAAIVEYFLPYLPV
jgi:hypothetical protein